MLLRLFIFETSQFFPILISPSYSELVPGKGQRNIKDLSVRHDECIIFGLCVVLTSISVRRGVSKRLEDGRRLPALREG
jgi:hypothetical protein